jgi:hypothetical protein
VGEAMDRPPSTGSVTPVTKPAPARKCTASAIGSYVAGDAFSIYPRFAQIESALAAQVQAALIGKTSPKEALATAKTQMEGMTT